MYKSAIAQDHTYICTLSIGPDWTPRVLQPCKSTPRPLGSTVPKARYLSISKAWISRLSWEYSFPSKPDGWKNNQMKIKIQERKMMILTVPIHTWLCNVRRPPAQGAQATSCFFPGSKYSGKFGFLACSDEQEPLVIYALTYPSFPLYATNRPDKNTKFSIKSLPSSVSLASGLWSFSEYRQLNCNLFLEAWLENLTDLHGHLRRQRTLPTWRKIC